MSGARAWWIAAAIAALLSLGLPWSSTAGYTIPGWFVPDSYVPDHSDGTIDVIPGGFGLPITVGGTTSAGYQTSIRVFVVVVVVLLVLAARRRATTLATAAVAVAVTGVLVTGLPTRAGGFAYAIAVACLVVALRHDGLLPRRAPRQPRGHVATGPPGRRRAAAA